MIKANIKTAKGTEISIEGDKDEVKDVLGVFSERIKPVPQKSIRKPAQSKKSKSRAGLAFYLTELLEGGFFKDPKSLEQVEKQLSIDGHLFQKKHISYALLRLIRGRKLRRLPKKEGKKRVIYIYTTG